MSTLATTRGCRIACQPWVWRRDRISRFSAATWPAERRSPFYSRHSRRTESYDPRQGGYSKLFAFLRSLQTSEERAATGLLALGGSAVARLGALAAVCEEKGDADTRDLLRSELIPDEQRRTDEGRERLVLLATAEDSQAHARRAIYKTVELLGELYEPGALKRILGRAARK